MDSLSRSYGSKSYQDDQLEYMKYRLGAGRRGKTNSTKEQLDELEKFLKENYKISKDKTVKTSVKKELSESEVLQLRIGKLEEFLSNEVLMAKLNEKALNAKTQQLNNLKEQLNNLMKENTPPIFKTIFDKIEYHMCDRKLIK